MKIGLRLALTGAASLTIGLSAAAPAFAQPARPAPTPEERAAALTRPAVVYLEQHWSGYVFDEEGKLFNNNKPYEIVTRCTGFGVSPDGYIATAGHCVDPGMEGIGREFLAKAVTDAIDNSVYNTSDPARLMTFAEENWKIEGKTKGSGPDRQVFMQRGVVAGGKTTGEALPARVVDFRPLSQGDVALLKVETTDLPAIELASAGDVQVGTKVLSIGYPGSTDEVTDSSFEPTNKDGEISALKTSDSMPLYEMSAALSGGMSGGPTVNMDGKVVGTNSFKINGEEQAFNYIAPSSNLQELLTRNGVKPALGEVDQLFRKGLDQYFAGRYTDAIRSFDKVLSLSPTHQQAQEYKTKAAKAREQYGDVKTGNGGAGLLVVIVLGLLGLVLIAGVVVLVLVLVARRRRIRPTTGYPGGPVPVGVVDRDLGQAPTMPLNHPVHAWDPQQAPATPAGAATAVLEPTQVPVPAAPTAHFCGNCGAPAPSGGRFCQQCGTAVGT